FHHAHSRAVARRHSPCSRTSAYLRCEATERGICPCRSRCGVLGGCRPPERPAEQYAVPASSFVLPARAIPPFAGRSRSILPPEARWDVERREGTASGLSASWDVLCSRRWRGVGRRSSPAP